MSASPGGSGGDGAGVEAGFLAVAVVTTTNNTW